MSENRTKLIVVAMQARERYAAALKESEQAASIRARADERQYEAFRAKEDAEQALLDDVLRDINVGTVACAPCSPSVETG